MDLFNFDLVPEYVDRYAGVSNYDKYRKMMTKSNVDMIIDNFVPFSAAKRSAHGVGTIISVDGSNIESTDQRCVSLTAGSNHAKNRKIVINNEAMASQMENIHTENEFEFFESQMKFAYGSFANLNKCAAFGADYASRLSDGELSEDYMYLIDFVHQAAKARVSGYMPDYSKMMKSMPDPEVLEVTSLAALAEDLYRGEDITGAAKIIDGCNKSTGDWRAIEAVIQGIISDDISSKRSLDEVTLDAEIVPTFNTETKPPEEDDDAKEACEVGRGHVSYDESPSFSEQPTDKDKSWELENDALEVQESSKLEDDKFFDTGVISDREDFAKYDHLVDALHESLVGRMGKKNSMNPSKRLNKRNVAAELSDNIYVSVDPVGGKKLNINVIIDTSGSMSGEYIDDAVYILYVFNQLARRGVVTGKIMLSASGISGMWDFPLAHDKLKNISAWNGGEGFRHTMAIRWKEMLAADFNVAITDGQLTDGYIDLAAFESAGIFVTGMYVHRGMDKKKITSYTGGLKRWFSNSIVRGSVEECVYSIVDQAILQLGSGNGNS
ncbi:MAG: hypothetical protein DRJ64_04510 [Thermoprotei archaeon]|nr:MAG: hypothetical protein DRJ64_04510 [Thermoprotei archaeon]